MVDTENIQSILKGIHAAKDYERQLFGAEKRRFNENLSHWVSQMRPDHADNNCYIPDGILTTDDIQAAIDANVERGLPYILFSMNRPMEDACLKRYALDLDRTYVMVMKDDRSHQWQYNDAIQIRDIQNADIRKDIMDVSDVPQQYRAAACRNMQMVVDVAKTHPNYHWLCAYKDSKKVGSAYAMEYNGFVEIDDLWVDEAFRHQKIATTIMKYIADHTHGILYLHASADGTPKDMYSQMGFETVETIYEYYMEW